MMQQADGQKLKGARIVGERPMNIKFVNCPGWVITRGYKYLPETQAGITFAVKLG
jgi:hypothetical protein